MPRAMAVAGQFCVPGRVRSMRPTRGDGLLSTAQAARLAGRSPATIRSWAHRGHIAPAGLDERGYPLYRAESVRAAERAVRANGLAASGIDPRRQCRRVAA